MARKLLLAVVGVVFVFVGAFAGSFEFCRAGEIAIGLFNNLTGKTVDELLLRLSSPLQPIHTIGIGANMRAEVVSSTEIRYAGFVVPGGTWEVDWLWDGLKLESAAWLLNGEVVEEVDVHVPTARASVRSSGDLGVRCAALGSIDPDGQPLRSCRWEWADGSTQVAERIERTFAKPGWHSVRLTVEDTEGKTSTTHCVFYVHEPEKEPVEPPAPLSPYVIAVHDYDFTFLGSQADWDRHGNPENIVGAHDTWDVGLGHPGGHISGEMEMRIQDGPGADLRIWEEGTREPFDVLISLDGTTWIQVATGVSKAGSWPTHLYVDIDIAPLSGAYSYVRVVNRSSMGGGSPGADVDAIEVLNSPD